MDKSECIVFRGGDTFDLSCVCLQSARRAPDRIIKGNYFDFDVFLFRSLEFCFGAPYVEEETHED